MKPSAFAYHRPSSVDEALALLVEHPDDAKVLAGGQSLIPLMNFRLSIPEQLVDINDIDELRGCESDGTVLRLGALTRHRELDTTPEIAAACPLLAQAAPFIGHPQIRSMGTLGGSISHADPSAELPGLMVVLDAVIVARGSRGERRIPASEFFSFHFTTTLEPGEIVASVEIPVAGEHEGAGFFEVAARHGDFAMAGAAATITVGPDDTVADARIACIAVASTPVRMSAAEEVLRGRQVTEEVLAEVAAAVRDNLDPTPDLKVSAAYKKRTAGVLARRAVERAFHNARTVNR